MRPSLLSLSALAAILLTAGCAGGGPDQQHLTAELTPFAPTDSVRLLWSPKGSKVPLTANAGGLEGAIQIGAKSSSPIAVRLEKTDGSEYYNNLKVDLDRDGNFADSELLETTPNESRHKMWSSFKTELSIDVTDSVTGATITNPYPISAWYVQDLREEPDEHLLRFTRRGWMQGTVTVDNEEIHVLFADSNNDGFLDVEDKWGLALPDSVANLYTYEHGRPAARHAWLGEQAYRIVNIGFAGRLLTIEPIDPGVTRAKEALDDDQMAVDRGAARSDQQVDFMTDFAAAEALAKRDGKNLFIDFETVWCGPCKSMEEWVYTADAVVEASESVIAVKVDGDDFPEIVERFEVVGYPTMILMSPDGGIAKKISGYQGVESMTNFLSD